MSRAGAESGQDEAKDVRPPSIPALPRAAPRTRPRAAHPPPALRRPPPPPQRQAWLESLSRAELEQLRAVAWDRLAKAKKVTVAGETMTLKALREQALRERAELESGMYDETSRSIPRWQAQRLVPSERLRPGAHKQMLRPAEEAALELQRMGHGSVFSPPARALRALLPGRREFAFGVFARPERARAVLGAAWAGRDPAATLSDPAFYADVLRRCHQVELTLMLLASRPLPLAAARPAVEAALRSRMEVLGGAAPLPAGDAADLAAFVHLLDDRRLEGAAWVERGAVRRGTHLIFSATPAGGLTAEAITPGALAERRTSLIGVAKSPLLTAAVFDSFLGAAPLDARGRRQVGAGLLWAANWLSFAEGEHPDVRVAVRNERGELDFPPPEGAERISPADAAFRLLEASARPARMLLGRIAAGAAEWQRGGAAPARLP